MAGAKFKEEEIPDDMKDKVEEYRNHLLKQLHVGMTLMEQYLESGPGDRFKKVYKARNNKG